MVEEIKLITETKKGTRLLVPASIDRVEGRIFFVDSPFALKNEIKAMQGSKWHGHLKGDGRMMWSVADCTRNNFQLDYMTGGNPYANWEKPLQHWDYSRPLKQHQCLMTDHGLTYHYVVLAAEMGLGKTLSAIEIIEKSGVTDPWWVGPKSAIASVEREFEKWGLTVQPRLMTYDRLRIDIERWEDGMAAPQLVVFDESSRMKTDRAKRTKAAQHLADAVRREWGWDGYIIPMSGTPAPKSPVDWWSQCEICYPGFIKEGSAKAFEQRLAIFEKQSTDQGEFWKRKTWRDDAAKCDICGELLGHKGHDKDEVFGMGMEAHTWVPSVNEVAYLYERLEGLVLPLSKADNLDLPEKIYREIKLEPTSTMRRVAKALASAAPTAIQGLTWLRELSDGFQYKDKQEGMETCKVCNGAKEYKQWYRVSIEGEEAINCVEVPDVPGGVHYWDDGTEYTYEKRLETCDVCDGTGEVPHMVRETKQIKCPKDQAVRDLLDEVADQGRQVIFAGFRGSIDRVVALCHAQSWDVVRVDGRGWKVMRHDGEINRTKPLDYWADMDNDRVVFVAHPESGGMGLTLTESRMAVFYSNDFKPESRSQAEDRIHRMGTDMNRGATIVDIFHLGTDKKVLDVLKDNRRLEKMTLEQMKEML